MSYNPKYRTQFDDIKNIEWKVEIEEDASVSVSNLIPTGNPLTFRWDNDDDDVFDPIKTSEATLNFLQNENFKYSTLYSQEDMKYKVNVYDNSTLFWSGYLKINEYKESYDSTPNLITAKAVCGLDLLKDILYKDDDEYYTGRKYESEIILDILGKINHTSFIEYINIYESSIGTDSLQPPFNKVRIDTAVFKDMYCDEALRFILNKYNACIVQKNGLYQIYRPTEIVDASVYGRIITSSSITETSYNPTQFIHRNNIESPLVQLPGGSIMITRPAKSVTVKQDYGFRESWLDNHKLPVDSYNKDTHKFDSWTSYTVGVALPISIRIPEEDEGVFMLSVNDIPPTSLHIKQSLGYIQASPNDICAIEFDYLLYNFSGGTLNNVNFRVGLYKTDESYYLEQGDDEWNTWSEYERYMGTGNISVDNTDDIQWLHYSKKFMGFPETGEYEFMFPLLYSQYSTKIIAAIKNVKIYTTSDTFIYEKRLKDPIWLKYASDRRREMYYRRRPLAKIYEDVDEVIEKSFEINNSINGELLERNFILGDVVDPDITNISAQYKGALTYPEPVKRLDRLRIQGTSGTASIRCNGVTTIMNFTGNVIFSIENWATTYQNIYYNNNVNVTYSLDTVYFEHLIPGNQFSEDTRIHNLSGDLNGSVFKVIDPDNYDSSINFPTKNWNRKNYTDDLPLLNIIGNEIAEQYSRPKQLAQITLKEMGVSTPTLDLTGSIVDTFNINRYNSIFNVIDIPAWSTYMCNLTPGDGYTTYTATGPDSHMYLDTSFKGSQYFIIEMKYRMSSGSFSGAEIYYKTKDHGRLGSYYRHLSFIDDDEWHTATFDMRELQVGGLDWYNSIITGVWFDLIGNASGTIDIEYIGVNRKFVFNRGSYDARNRIWDVDFCEII